jgi:hypothetical protein
LPILLWRMKRFHGNFNIHFEHNEMMYHLSKGCDLEQLQPRLLRQTARYRSSGLFPRVSSALKPYLVVLFLIVK